MKLNKKKLLIIILVLFALIAIALGVFFLGKSSNEKEKGAKEKKFYADERYNYSKEIVEPTGTKVIKNDAMVSKHCLNDICVTDAVFYTNGQDGRVECTIWNYTSKKATGRLKMNFGKGSLLINYENLKPLTSVQYVSYFSRVDFGEVTDYKLEELTEEDLNSIISDEK